MRNYLSCSVACSFLAACSSIPDTSTVGSMAPDYLHSDTFEKVQVEFDTIEGRELNEALEVGKEAMMAATMKGTPILEGWSTLPSEPSARWDTASLRELERKHRVTPVRGDHIGFYVMVVDGAYTHDTENNKRLAMAYSGTSIAVFADTIQDTCDYALIFESDPTVKAGLCEAMFGTALVHELGHLLGLVDEGTSMVEDHLDPDHKGHCNNPECVMHWASEQGKSAELVRTFLMDGKEGLEWVDEACVADIIAARQ